MKLKTLILSFFISFVAISNSSAQTDSTSIKTKSVEADNYVPQSTFRKVRLGIYGTLGASWLKPKTTGYTSGGSHTTYSYGLILDYNFTENYTFSSGISYNSLSGELSYNDSSAINGDIKEIGKLNRTYRINSIEIPTLLKLKSNQMGYFTYFAELGIRHNFRLSSFADDSFTYDDPKKTLVSENQDMKDYVSFYRLSFSFAIGTEYAISKTLSAYASIGYDNGLTNTLSGENRLTNDSESAFMKKIAFTAGFLF